MPSYPQEALERGIHGQVVVFVVIDKDGSPKRLRVQQGHPLLADAALEAIKQWRWEPFKLNGKAVPVDTTVTVNFEKRKAQQR
jgi:protein TonB